MDFSANISNRVTYQTSKEYFENTSWPCFNITTFNQSLGFFYWDFLAKKGTRKNSIFVYFSLKMLIEHFQIPEHISEIHVFSDGGAHLKNSLVLSSVFSLFEPWRRPLTVHWFVSYHGKSACDRHFGMINRQKANFRGEVRTIQDLLACIDSLSHTHSFFFRKDFQQPLFEAKQKLQGIRGLLSVESTSVSSVARTKTHPDDEGSLIDTPSLVHI